MFELFAIFVFVSLFGLGVAAVPMIHSLLMRL